MSCRLMMLIQFFGITSPDLFAYYYVLMVNVIILKHDSTLTVYLKNENTRQYQRDI